MTGESRDRPIRVCAIVPAAGSGSRLGAGAPKALVELGGMPLLSHAVAALLSTGRVDEVVLAAPEGLIDAVAGAAALVAGGVPVRVVAGGQTRAESVSRALAVVADTAQYVLVHDAARALVPTEVVNAVLDALEQGARAVVPGLPVVDTVRQLAADGSSRTLDRTTLRAVQTPQGFAASVLRRAHAAGPELAEMATDDAGMVEALGEPITIVGGDPQAMKVTTPLDLAVAGQILAGRSRQSRVGSESDGGTT